MANWNKMYDIKAAHTIFSIYLQKTLYIPDEKEPEKFHRSVKLAF